MIWNGQARDAHGVSWSDAVARPVAGIAVRRPRLRRLAALSPAMLAWSLPLTFGYLVAIPFAVSTARQAWRRSSSATALCGIPEELEPPAEIRAARGV